MLAFVIAKTRKQFASPLNLRYVAAPALVSIRTQWALTREEIKKPVAQTRVGRADRVYRVDARRSPETLEVRGFERRQSRT